MNLSGWWWRAQVTVVCSAILGAHVGRSNSQSHLSSLELDPGDWWLSVGPRLSDYSTLPHHKLHSPGKVGLAFLKRRKP